MWLIHGLNILSVPRQLLREMTEHPSVSLQCNFDIKTTSCENKNT